MSNPENEHGLSWLDLREPEVLSDEVKAAYATSIANIGFVRGMQKLMANVPEVMLAQGGLSGALMKSPSSNLSFKEREIMALVVSVENRCAPCIFAHASQLRSLGLSAVWVGTIEANYRHADLTPRERALADYAIKLTRAPGDMNKVDIDPLREAGLSEVDIIFAAGIIAFYNFSNRLCSGLGIATNTPDYEGHRG